MEMEDRSNVLSDSDINSCERVLRAILDAPGLLNDSNMSGVKLVLEKLQEPQPITSIIIDNPPEPEEAPVPTAASPAASPVPMVSTFNLAKIGVGITPSQLQLKSGSSFQLVIDRVNKCIVANVDNQALWMRSFHSLQAVLLSSSQLSHFTIFFNDSAHPAQCLALSSNEGEAMKTMLDSIAAEFGGGKRRDPPRWVPAEELLFAGVVQKKGKMGSNWNSRWIEIKNGALFVYKKRSAVTANYILSLVGADILHGDGSATITKAGGKVPAKKQHMFCVFTDKKYSFRANSGQECSTVLSLLQKAQKTSSVTSGDKEFPLESSTQLSSRSRDNVSGQQPSFRRKNTTEDSELAKTLNKSWLVPTALAPKRFSDFYIQAATKSPEAAEQASPRPSPARALDQHLVKVRRGSLAGGSQTRSPLSNRHLGLGSSGLPTHSFASFVEVENSLNSPTSPSFGNAEYVRPHESVRIGVFALMKQVFNTMNQGARITSRLFMPKSAWIQSGLKLVGFQEKLIAFESLQVGLLSVLVLEPSKLNVEKLERALIVFRVMAEEVQDKLAKNLAFIHSCKHGVKQEQRNIAQGVDPDMKRKGISLGRGIKTVIKTASRKTTTKERVEDSTRYVRLVRSILEQAQVFGAWDIKEYGWAPEAVKKIDRHLDKIAEFLYTVFLNIVVRDMSVVIKRYFKLNRKAMLI